MLRRNLELLAGAGAAGDRDPLARWRCPQRALEPDQGGRLRPAGGHPGGRGRRRPRRRDARRRGGGRRSRTWPAAGAAMVAHRASLRAGPGHPGRLRRRPTTATCGCSSPAPVFRRRCSQRDRPDDPTQPIAGGESRGREGEDRRPRHGAARGRLQQDRAHAPGRDGGRPGDRRRAGRVRRRRPRRPRGGGGSRRPRPPACSTPRTSTSSWPASWPTRRASCRPARCSRRPPRCSSGTPRRSAASTRTTASTS